MVRKLGVALLKLLTCMVGCAIAGLVICAFGGFHGYADDGLYIGWLMAGAIFGIFVGISLDYKTQGCAHLFCCAVDAGTFDLSDVAFIG